MKVALVTGGTKGIGLAIAKKLQKAGYKTVISYFNDDIAAKKAQESCGFDLIKCDVSSIKEMKNAVKNIVKIYDSLDVLVNCAGISLKQKTVLDVTEEEFDKTFAVNVKGVFSATNACLPFMIEKNSGTIVNVSSVWGIDGGSCEAVYSASKGAVIAYTKALSKELAFSGIRVNAVAPGFIDTDMNSHLSKEEKVEFFENLTVKRAGSVDEVADAVMFLIENEYMAGQILRIDGGM